MVGINRMRRYARWLRSYTRRNAVVLLYHRVAEVAADPQALCVTPTNFSEQIDVLRSIANPISSPQLDIAMRDQKLPRRGVLVTFDDGYADNLYNAKPILEKYKVPATVFVAAGYVGFEGEFWWDELERLLFQTRPLPEHLQLRLNGNQIEWKLGKSAVVYTEENHREHRDWNIGKKDVPTQRHALYVSLYKLIRPLPAVQRGELFETLRVWSGCPSGSREGYRPLTALELQRLRDGNLVEIGAHTTSHPVLSCLPPDNQRNEIRDSKSLLEGIVDHPITSFAYPFGSPADYTLETLAAVQEAGFVSAFSTSPGVVGKKSERFRLPRNVVRNWNGDAFARRLRGWLSYE